VTGARRAATIELNRFGTKALVTVNHDTAVENEQRFDIPWRFGDITFTLANPFRVVTDDLVPDNLSYASRMTGRKSAIDAHSMAVGDINCDGMEDVLVGDLDGAFALLQTRSGPFLRVTNSVFDALSHWHEPGSDRPNDYNYLTDLALADLNGDGAVDLVAGWASGYALSRVFFNDGKGGFSIENSTPLPPTVYGPDNTIHLDTFIGDFDGDGDNDIIISHSRSRPYYGGNYLQYLSNDGQGHFRDETTARFGDPTKNPDTFGERGQWSNEWQLFDVNKDGHPDIMGKHSFNGKPFFYLNDGTGHFTSHEIEGFAAWSDVRILSWGDVKGDGATNAIGFLSIWDDAEGTSSTNRFVFLQFSSGPSPAVARAFDLSGNAGLVAKTLGAVFGANSIQNQTYVGIGLALVDAGLSYDQLLDLALSAALGERRSNESVVSLLFSNLIGRAPSMEEENMYAGLISSGICTQVDLARFAADSSLNTSHIDLVGLSQNGLDYIPYGG
jgi:hypothetical protein